jgi:hypothetical protein
LYLAENGKLAEKAKPMHSQPARRREAAIDTDDTFPLMCTSSWRGHVRHRANGGKSSALSQPTIRNTRFSTAIQPALDALGWPEV